MDARSQLAAQALAAAVGLGILADALLRAGPWGLNIGIWTLALVVTATVLSARSPVGQSSRPTWPAVLVLLFALLFTWRDAPGVKLFNAFAMAVCLLIWVERHAGERVRAWTVLDYVRGILNSAAAAGVGPLHLNKADIDWTTGAESRKFTYARSAALGLLISIPLLFIFGGLLVAADAVFERLVSETFDFDIANVLSHGALTAFFAWIVAGLLLVFLNLKRRAFSELRVDRPGLGIVEVAVPLAVLNLLFIVFVLVQLRYLFGDASLVEGTVGLTYSEYARRGFFELVAVVALVLPLLLGADWVLGDANRRNRRTYRFLAGALVLLLLAVVASAVKRMLLYQGAYGLTELRVYTTAFMAWLGIVLLWFCATVLRERRAQFATGAALFGFAVIGAVNLLNPDALIARVNTDRALRGEEFDAAYAASLSGDAIPKLVSKLADLDPTDRCRVAVRLLDRWDPANDSDWRTWNLGRTRAQRAVGGARPRLEAWACEPAVESGAPTTEPQSSDSAPSY
jgi:hypothetical protein